mmetsp:Transcript_1294/g.1851  ORF Transcript_1294/g.1851 Transcript_1294/m.1851 type:complete len:217 (-) Transcript_1294:37-687(-)
MKSFNIIHLALSASLASAWAPSSRLQNRVHTALQMNNSRKAREMRETFAKSMEEPYPVTKASEVEGSVDDDELVPLVTCIAKAADMRKAEDIVCIRVSKLTTTTSFVVLCSGNSRPQNQAIAAAIQDEVLENFGEKYELRGPKPEGNADSGWILLDFGSVMCHIMTPRSRLFYDIEGKWKKGEVLNIDDILVPNSAGGSSSSGGSADIDENDPFWS